MSHSMPGGIGPLIFLDLIRESLSMKDAVVRSDGAVVVAEGTETPGDGAVGRVRRPVPTMEGCNILFALAIRSFRLSNVQSLQKC